MKHLLGLATLVLAAVTVACAGQTPATPQVTSVPQSGQDVAPQTTKAPEPSATPNVPQPQTTTPTKVAATAQAPEKPATGAPTQAPVKAAGGTEVTEAEVKRMAAAFASAKSYRTTYKGGDGSEVAVEVVKPDRIHTRVTFPGGNAELIRIGNDGWVLTPAGPSWTKISGSDNPMGGLPTPEAFLTGFQEGQARGDKQIKGSVITVNGVKCEEWIASGPQGTATICVGVNEYLPVQIKSGDGKFKQTFSDWNAALKIEPPI